MEQGPSTSSFFKFLPASLFGGIMGLAGLSFCWKQAVRAWGAQMWINEVIGVTAIILFLVLAVAYLIKIRRYPQLVKAEFDHPVSVSFFATIPISLLLLPGVLRQYDLLLAEWVWGIGAVLMFLFAWVVMRKWMDSRQDPGNALPAWVLPVAGTLNVPIVGAFLPINGANEICLLFFGIGILFAIILTTMVISRLFFQPAMPKAVQPTLLILVATFALVFSGYVGITGRHDIFASIFFYFDLFLFLLFGSKIFLLPKCCPLRVSWWSVSFPLAGVTSAAFRYAEFNDTWVFNVLAGVLLALTSFVILYLLIQTFTKIIKGDMFLHEAAAERSMEQLYQHPAEGK